MTGECEHCKKILILDYIQGHISYAELVRLLQLRGLVLSQEEFSWAHAKVLGHKNGPYNFGDPPHEIENPFVEPDEHAAFNPADVRRELTRDQPMVGGP